MTESSEDYIWSIKNGDLESISKYITSNPKIINELIKGRTYLHYACDYGQKEIIEYLLSRGANINVILLKDDFVFYARKKDIFVKFKIPDKYNITPLLAAIWENHVDCVKLLLSKGANRHIKSPDGKSLLECTDNAEIQKLIK